jgi:arsenate reductase
MEESYTIYHNPRCRKSREALKFLEEKGVNPEVVKYLDEPLGRKELEVLLAKLNLDVQEIIRKEEKLYKEKYKNMNFTDEEWLIILEENPKLIQRPIVVNGHKAVIGRPLENVQKLLNKS